jgi:hypothetical protein
MRSSHGRKPIFSDPEQLWDACVQYFEWCEENPLYEEKVFSAHEGLRRAEVMKMRAMTIQGLCFFLGISDETWANYKTRDDFIGITREVEAVIYQQKFSGAAADLLNANIIARDLGLKEKSETELTGKNGGPIEFTDTQRAARLAAILERVQKRSTEGTN